MSRAVACSRSGVSLSDSSDNSKSKKPTLVIQKSTLNQVTFFKHTKGEKVVLQKKTSLTSLKLIRVAYRKSYFV